MAALRGLNTGCARPPPAAARVRLCKLHRQRKGMPAGPWIDALQRANAALVAQRLQDLVRDPAPIGFAREGLHLCRIFSGSGLMQWQLHGILHATPLWVFGEFTPARHAAGSIERHRATLHRACGELAAHLDHHLREQLT